MFDEPPSDAALITVGVVPSGTTLAEVGMGTTVSTDIEVWLVPVGPTRVELNWPYGAAVTPVPCIPPIEMPAESRG